jgi:hypothetical protein
MYFLRRGIICNGAFLLDSRAVKREQNNGRTYMYGLNLLTCHNPHHQSQKNI